jgi:hypothetical protein
MVTIARPRRLLAPKITYDLEKFLEDRGKKKRSRPRTTLRPLPPRRKAASPTQSPPDGLGLLGPAGR